MQPIGRTYRTLGAADLLKASINGDFMTARTILKRRRATISTHGADGCTPLLLACKHGHLDLVKLYLAHGASFSDRDRDPKRQGNAIHYAAWGGHATVVNHLIDQGANLDEVDIVGNTALLYAVYGGHRRVVMDLIARGRSLNERNSKNHTALLQAACGGHLHLMRWLLQQGFTLDEADHDGNTALLFAAWGGHLELIHFLLENGSNLDEQNHNGHSIFLSAANGGRVEIVEWLLTKGFSLTETNNNGDTALLLAAYGGHQPLVERLLQLGSSLQERNGCGFTPLLSAANGGQLEMAKWLLSHGSSLDECDNDGYTSLILAACGGNVDLVKFLLANGSSLEDRNNNGDSALLLAAYCSHKDLVDWLIRNGSSLAEKNKTGMGVLISASNGGNIDVVELLLQRITEAGPDCGDGLEHTDEGGYTPLLLAAQRGHLDVVKLLVSYGANIQARTTRHDNDALALAMDFPEVQKYLEAVSGWTPLQVAIDNRMIDRVHTLLQAGASLEVATGPSCLELSTLASSYANAKPPVREIELLVRQASMPWAPCRHQLFAKPHRASIHNLMRLQAQLRKQSTHPIMPPEIWLHIATFVDRAWFVEDQQQLQIGWLESSSQEERASYRQRKLFPGSDRVTLTDAGSADQSMVSCEMLGIELDVDDEDEQYSESGRRARNSTSAASAAVVAFASGGADKVVDPFQLTEADDGAAMYDLDDDMSSVTFSSAASSSIFSKGDSAVDNDAVAEMAANAMRIAWVYYIDNTMECFTFFLSIFHDC